MDNLSSKVPDFISCIFVTDNRQLAARGTESGKNDEKVLNKQSKGITVREHEKVPDVKKVSKEERDSLRKDNKETIQMINAQQFKAVTDLFDDYYGMHEPKHEKYEKIRQLRQRLNCKKVLNVNVVENENLKIQKENEGKGVQVDKALGINDSSMQMFRKELVKFLLTPNKEDKYMTMKIASAKKVKKNEEKNEMDKLERQIKMLEQSDQDSEEKLPTIAENIVQEDIEDLRK